MSKYGNIIKQVKEEKKSKTTIAKAETLKEDPLVSISIKVPKSQRIYWTSEAKRNDTTIASIIREALTNKFGLPKQVMHNYIFM